MDKRPMQLLVNDEGDKAELLVYGDIWEGAHVMNYWAGIQDGTDSVEVAQAISQLPESVGNVTVRINSYGGDVSEGLAIYNALKACGRPVTTVVDGFACSIASVVFMAGERRVMSPASLLMVHNPWMSTEGNAEQLRKDAEDLDIIAEASKAAYVNASGIDRQELDSLMDAETWIESSRALELGLATEVVEDDDPGRPAQSVRDSVARALVGPMRGELDAKPTPTPSLPTPEDEAPQEEEPKRGYARLAALLS